MNKFRPFLAFLLVGLLLSVPVFADDDTGDTSPDTPSASEDASSAPEDSASAPDPTPPSSEDSAFIPDPAPPPPEDSASAPDPSPLPPEDVPPDTAPVDPPASTETPPENPDVVPPPDISFDTYNPAYVGSGGAIESFQTTSDNGTSVVLVDVQSHDMISVSSVGVLDASAYSLEDGTDNSLVQVVRRLFGTYTPRTQTVTTYYDGQPLSVDEQIIPGLGGLDWEWITGACLFLLMLYCLFRLLGGVVRYG